LTSISLDEKSTDHEPACCARYITSHRDEESKPATFRDALSAVAEGRPAGGSRDYIKAMMDVKNRRTFVGPPTHRHRLGAPSLVEREIGELWAVMDQTTQPPRESPSSPTGSCMTPSSDMLSLTMILTI
jgi:hypothetical protein